MSSVPPIGGVPQVNALAAKLAEAEVAAGGIADDAEKITNAIERAGLEIALAVARLGVAVTALKT